MFPCFCIKGKIFMGQAKKLGNLVWAPRYLLPRVPDFKARFLAISSFFLHTRRFDHSISQKRKWEVLPQRSDDQVSGHLLRCAVDSHLHHSPGILDSALIFQSQRRALRLLCLPRVMRSSWRHFAADQRFSVYPFSADIFWPIDSLFSGCMLHADCWTLVKQVPSSAGVQNTCIGTQGAKVHTKGGFLHGAKTSITREFFGQGPDNKIHPDFAGRIVACGLHHVFSDFSSAFGHSAKHSCFKLSDKGVVWHFLTVLCKI